MGNWNSVVTSSIDRSVKVWNINNIFEQVHVIDRHELQIDMIRYTSARFILSRDHEKKIIPIYINRVC